MLREGLDSKIITNHENSSSSISQDSEAMEASTGISLSHLANFVGTNWSVYESAFTKFHHDPDHKFTFSWHWPGFFIFFFWSIYRKMWPATIGYVAIISVLYFLFSPSSVFLLGSVLSGASAKYIYYRYAVWKLMRSSSLELRASQQLGGVSIKYAIIGVVAFFVGYAYLSQALVTNFMEKNVEEFTHLQPGSGSQIWGDGNVISNVASLDPAQAENVTRLVNLAKVIKLFYLVFKDVYDKDTAYEMINEVQFSSMGNADVWGSGLKLEKDSSGFLVKSAGADKMFGNDDDMIQLIDIK